MSQLRKEVYYNKYGTADLEAVVQQWKKAVEISISPAEPAFGQTKKGEPIVWKRPKAVEMSIFLANFG